MRMIAVRCSLFVTPVVAWPSVKRKTVLTRFEGATAAEGAATCGDSEPPAAISICKVDYIIKAA